MDTTVRKAPPKVLPKPGRVVARCVSIIDMGTQKNQFGGENRIIRFEFEIPSQTHTFKEEKGAQPLLQPQEYNMFFSEKSKLQGMLQDWRNVEYKEGDDIPVKKYLGQPAKIRIKKKTSKAGNEYTVIDDIEGAEKGSCPERINPLRWLDLADFKQEDFDNLHEWQRDKISESPEYQTLFEDNNHEEPQESFDDGEDEEGF